RRLHLAPALDLQAVVVAPAISPSRALKRDRARGALDRGIVDVDADGVAPGRSSGARKRDRTRGAHDRGVVDVDADVVGDAAGGAGPGGCQGQVSAVRGDAGPGTGDKEISRRSTQRIRTREARRAVERNGPGARIGQGNVEVVRVGVDGATGGAIVESNRV